MTTDVVGLCGVDPCGVSGLGQQTQVKRVVAVAAPTRRYVSLGQGMMTAASDTPADTYIEPRLSAPDIRIRRELPATGERLQGFVAETAATLQLDGADGGLDSLLTDEVMRDRPVSLKKALTTKGLYGEVPPALSAFAPAFAGRCTNIEIDTSSRVSITVADDFSRLDRPIQQRTYAGTGGLEGDADVTGLPLPLCYGVAPGHEPTLIDRLRLIYQVHDGQVLSIRVHDRGEPITVVRDVETYEDLVALVTAGEIPEDDEDAEFDIGFGQAATCRKQGYFRLGSSPVGPVTTDCEGDGLYDGPIGYDDGTLYDDGIGYEIPGSTTHNRYAGGIVYRVLTTRGGYSPTEIDIDRINQFDAEHPWRMGISIPSGERPTVREVCTRVVDSVGAVIVRNRLGQMFVRALTGPAGGSQIKIGPTDISPDGVERLALPWGAPWHTVTVTYAPRFRPLTSDETSAALTDAEAALFERVSASVRAGNTDLAVVLPDRPPLEIATLLVEQADAKIVARQVLNFYRGIWALYRVAVRGIGLRADVLSTVVLTFPRHGLNNGRPLLVLSVEEEPGANSTTLLLAG